MIFDFRLGKTSDGDPFVLPQGGGDGAEEVEIGELFVFAAVGPGGAEAELVAFLEPKRDLFDGGLFEVVGEGGLAWGGCGAGEDVAACVGDAGDGGLRVEG